ncbi:MAG: hypothetical protein NUV97_01580 [archaeon]|nr:hypothetical protein [archaeon]MCR4323645.1 hypothetical protein [Nanoarchaeota archaeon]
MDKTQKAKLKEIVDGGKWNYVLSKGSMYGLGMFLLFWFFTKFILEEEFYVGLNIVIWGIAGLVFGLWTWSNINKKLKEK